MNRRVWDRLVSGAGAVMAIVLILLGAAAIYGGNFGRSNVGDRLEPQNITFPPLEAMSPEEQEDIGDYAGKKVDTGEEAEAFSRYIGGHLVDINDGKTYSETSSEARAEGIDPDLAAELQGKADTLFKGETLRAILLNAYGWWTLATLGLFVGYGMVAAGVLLGVFAFLGFRHSRKAAEKSTPAKAEADVKVGELV